MSVRRTTADFEDQLQRQLDFLRNSAKAFDRVHREEAVRLAVALRVLFHQTEKSTSLVRLLGIENSVRLLTTIDNAYKTDPVTGRTEAVIAMWVSFDPDYTPPLGSARRRDIVPLADWWNQAVLCLEGNPVTRCQVVLAAANKDGGAHVDPKPAGAARKLISGTVTYQPEGSTEEVSLGNVHFALLRQFAYEILSGPALVT